MNAYVMVFGVVLMAFATNGADIGDVCQVARSGAQGVCKVINDCQPVIDDIVQNSLYPSQCGFRGRDQIVCCPVPMTTTTTTTPAPNRISQRSRLDFCVCLLFIFLYRVCFRFVYENVIDYAIYLFRRM